MHEEMLHFPSPFSYRFYEFIIVIDRQWEMNTFHLQFSIRSKLKTKSSKSSSAALGIGVSSINFSVESTV